MGSNLSSCNQTRNMRFLIGDLSKLSATEQKLFKLCEQVLNASKIDTKCNPSGTNIVPFSNDSDMAGDNAEVIERDRGASFYVLNDNLLMDSIHIEVGSLFVALALKKQLYMTQTFVQWKTSFEYETLLSCCKPLKRTIYIQPVDNFPGFIKEFEIKLENYRHSLNFLTFLQTFAEIFFSGMTVRVLPSFNLINSNWNITSRLHSKTGQKQYLVGDFFTKLAGVMPPDGYCIMGIIWTDLYPCEALNFVLGEASNIHKAGIHCFGRFEPKSYNAEGHQDITEIDGKLIWRLVKVFSHELCHLFGLGHCEYFRCTMNESGSMAEAYSQPLFLCPVCLRKLQYACDFDLLQRYKKFHTFMQNLCSLYPTPEMKHSVTWLEKCIEFLETDDQTC